MNLSDFSNMVFTAGRGDVTIYVFDSDEECDHFARGGENADILLTLHSVLKASEYLKEKYSSAKVFSIYAVGMNKLAVVIDAEGKK